MASVVMLVPPNVNREESLKVFELAVNGVRLANGNTTSGRHSLSFTLDEAIEEVREGADRLLLVFWPSRIGNGIDDEWMGIHYPDVSYEFVVVDKPVKQFHFTHAPLPFMRVTQPFGARKEYYSRWYGPNVGHLGIDFGGYRGMPIFSVAAGVVSETYTASRLAKSGGGHNFGYHVRVKHDGGYTSIYAHMDRVDVEVGDVVQGGQMLGTLDNTGNTSGPEADHLHFALKKEGSTQYPYEFVNPTRLLEGLPEPTPQKPTGELVQGYAWGKNLRIHNGGVGTIIGASNIRAAASSRSKRIGLAGVGATVEVANPNPSNGYYLVRVSADALRHYKKPVKVVDPPPSPKLSHRAEIADISYARTGVPAAQLKRQGIDGVYVKAGQTKNASVAAFDREAHLMRQGGLNIGAFWYADPRINARTAAQMFLRQLGKFTWDLPPAIDVEENGKYGPLAPEWWLDIFFDEFRKKWKGDVVIYTSARYWNAVTKTKTYGALLWLAAYTSKMPLILPIAFKNAKQKWWLWQNTDKYAVVGYPKGIDHNFYNGDDASFADRVAFFKKTGYWWKAPAAKVAPKPPAPRPVRPNPTPPKPAQPPSPAPADPLKYTGPPVKFHNGIHDRADRHATEADYSISKRGGFTALKTMSGATVESVRKYNVDLVVCRLFEKFEGRNVTPEMFMRSITPDFDKLWNIGVKWVEVHNEPNLTSEGLARGKHVGTWKNGTEYGRWFLRVQTLLKQRYSGIKVGIAALSPGGDTAYSFGHDSGWRYDSTRFFNEMVASGAVAASDWLPIHCYYQSDATVKEAIDRVWAFRRRFRDKVIMITEYSNPVPSHPQSVKGKQARAFIDGIKNIEGVHGAFYFIVSGSGWEHQALRTEASSFHAHSTGFLEAFL